MSDNEGPRKGDFTRLGFFLFAGLVLGSAIGGFGYHSPAPGALIGAGTGAVLALLLDFLLSRRA